MELGFGRAAVVALGGVIGAGAGLLVGNMQPAESQKCTVETVATTALTTTVAVETCVPETNKKSEKDPPSFPLPLLLIMTTGSGMGIAYSLTRED